MHSSDNNNRPSHKPTARTISKTPGIHLDTTRITTPLDSQLSIYENSTSGRGMVGGGKVLQHLKKHKNSSNMSVFTTAFANGGVNNDQNNTTLSVFNPRRGSMSQTQSNKP
jgi:hypothetical protein